MPQRPVWRMILVALLVAAPLTVLLFVTGYWWREQRLEHQFEPVIEKAAAKYRVDPLLVKAVIWRESRFDRNAKGRAGEIGLMQIMELTGEEWAEAERIGGFTKSYLWDPSQNIHAGAWYLAKCMRRYTNTDNPMVYALADYNAGRTHVLRWNKGEAATNSTVFLAQMDYPGTRKYAQSILERYDYYRRHESKSPVN